MVGVDRSDMSQIRQIGEGGPIEDLEDVSFQTFNCCYRYHTQRNNCNFQEHQFRTCYVIPIRSCKAIFIVFLFRIQWSVESAVLALKTEDWCGPAGVTHGCTLVACNSGLIRVRQACNGHEMGML